MTESLTLIAGTFSWPFSIILYRLCTPVVVSSDRPLIPAYKDHIYKYMNVNAMLTLTVLVATTDAQWEGMGDVGSARYELALLPSCLTIRVLSHSN